MSMNVLIVDDEPGYCALLSRALQTYDFVITTCSEPEGALERLLAGQVDLLVTDLHMPGLTGYDLTELAGRLPRTPKILVITAQKSLLEEAPRRLRGAQCLLKPFTLDDLRAKVGMLTGYWPAGEKPHSADQPAPALP